MKLLRMCVCVCVCLRICMDVTAYRPDHSLLLPRTWMPAHSCACVSALRMPRVYDFAYSLYAKESMLFGKVVRCSCLRHIVTTFVNPFPL